MRSVPGLTFFANTGKRRIPGSVTREHPLYLSEGWKSEFSIGRWFSWNYFCLHYVWGNKRCYKGHKMVESCRRPRAFNHGWTRMNTDLQEEIEQAGRRKVQDRKMRKESKRWGQKDGSSSLFTTTVATQSRGRKRLNCCV